jgi:hypothetical protein
MGVCATVARSAAVALTFRSAPCQSKEMPTYRSALQGGSKLPHSKPSLKKEGDKEWEWPKSTNSGGLQPGSADRGEQRITSIPLFSAR